MNQETYVNVKGLREQGWTIKEIAAETGFHPATISKHLKLGFAAGRSAYKTLSGQAFFGTE